MPSLSFSLSTKAPPTFQAWLQVSTHTCPDLAGTPGWRAQQPVGHSLLARAQSLAALYSQRAVLGWEPRRHTVELLLVIGPA